MKELLLINSDTWNNNETVPGALGHPRSLSLGIKQQKYSNPSRDHRLFSLRSSTVNILWPETVSKPMNRNHSKCLTCFWSVADYSYSFYQYPDEGTQELSKPSAKIKNFNIKTPVHSSTHTMRQPFWVCSQCALSITSISGERTRPHILLGLTTLLRFWQRSAPHMPVPSPKLPGPSPAPRQV